MSSFSIELCACSVKNQRSAQVVWVFRTVGSPIVTVFVFDESILGSTRNPLATGCNVNMKEVAATFNDTPRIPENIFHPVSVVSNMHGYMDNFRILKLGAFTFETPTSAATDWALSARIEELLFLVDSRGRAIDANSIAQSR